MPTHPFVSLDRAGAASPRVPARSEAFPEDLDHELAYPRRYAPRGRRTDLLAVTVGVPLALALLGAAAYLTVV